MAYPEAFIRPHEQMPATTGKILARFGREFERQTHADDREILGRAPIAAALMDMHDVSFQPTTSIVECPIGSYIVVASHLVGLTNPGDTQRLNNILCGLTKEHEDTIEPGALAGRRGTDYSPLSQCWRLTGELLRLVRFMREVKELPALTASPFDEDMYRLQLDARKEVRERTDRQQAVFTSWLDAYDMFANGLGSSDQIVAKLPGAGTQPTRSTAITPVAADAAIQLDIGGPKYQEVLAWVEGAVLQPLVGIVGERNLTFYLGELPSRISLAIENTAQHCPKKPHGGFFGSVS